MANVLVTGGSRGLGLGIARRLAKSGYRVIALARRESEELSQAMAECRATGTGEIVFEAFDLAETDKIHALATRLRKHFGPIYGLVNNAGIGTAGVLATMPDAEIVRLIQLNTLSPILLTKYISRAMLADGAGRIINVASIVGFSGFNGLSVYAATKASLIGFTRSLARELGRVGATVNAIAPGFVATEMTHDLTMEDREKIARRSALRRLAETDDIANAVEFLLGDGARNITGTVMTIDAGATA
ncbi:MAG: SDR family NAD(P)-dependent oxidoreductase [Methylovirgula sp.]|uniref:SDR family NAD(P)-dependent oxidoreductase n=1 Tax=Methylovirgula sp. TaxID=1978224 RepID=UPI0030760949